MLFVRAVPAFLSSLGVALCAATTAWADIDPATNPFAPTWQQVDARFARIEQEITRLRSVGSDTQASEMARELLHFRNELAGLEPSAIQSPELDWVGIYKGTGGTVGDPPLGNATINVRQTGRPIVLALSSYDPVRWNLQIESGVKLEKIILSGAHNPPRPLNLPSGVPVEVYTSQALSLDYPMAYTIDTYEYPKAARSLQKLAAADITTFQGIYTYATPITVGGNAEEWTAKRVIHEMKPLYDQAVSFERAQQRTAAADYSFLGVLRDPSDTRWPIRSSIAQFTPLGLVPGTDRQLPISPLRFTVDGSGNAYATAPASSIYKINLSNLEMTQVPVGGDGIPASFGYGGGSLAFDTKRDRLVLVNNSDEGAFYAYSPSQNKWSILSSLHNIDLQALTYSARDDSYYGLTTGSGRTMEICRFDPAGNLVTHFGLSRLVPSGPDPWGFGYQLIAVDDRVQIITPPAADLYNLAQPDQPWSALVDPHTGQVTYMDVLTVPEPATGLTALLAAGLVLRRRRRE